MSEAFLRGDSLNTGPAPIPEPGTMLLLGARLFGLASMSCGRSIRNDKTFQ
jgi:hypothetical protein